MGAPGATLFFYGSLLDADVRAAVLGPMAPPATEPATLAGWRRVTAPGAIFPIVLRAADGEVAGAIARGVPPAAVRRLDAYEGAGYRLEAVTVTLADGTPCEAQVYVPVRAVAGPGKPWDLDDWRRRHKRRFLARMKATGPYAFG